MSKFATKFRIVSAAEFGPKSFEYHPLWSEFYDNDELEEIEMWGLNKNTVCKELLNKTVENSHPYYTVPEILFPPTRMRFFTRAILTTKNGRKLQGSVMNSGEMCIEVFLNDSELITLSRHPHLKEMTYSSLDIISQQFRISRDELLKINYETTLTDKNGVSINGVFKIE